MSARVSREAVLWSAILVLAACLRLLSIGWPPLTDREAGLALAAAEGTPSQSAFWEDGAEVIPASPAYRTLTHLLFSFFGAGDAGARLIPALAGTLVVLLPLALRERLGRMAALLSGLALALSPTLVAASRTADGTSLALLGLTGWLAMTASSGPAPSSPFRWVVAGLLGGLGLAAGPSAVTGLVVLSIGWLLVRLMDRQPAVVPAGRPATQVLVAAALALALASGLGTRPEGVAGLFDSMGTWLTGWGGAGGMPPLAWLLTLPFHDVLLLAFGVWGATTGLRRGERQTAFLVAWAIAGLAVGLVYPGRQAADLVWTCVPLALLAGSALRDVLERAWESWSWAGHALLVSALLLLSLFVVYQLAAYALGRGPIIYPGEPALSLLLIVVAGALALLMVILFAFGWSREVAWTSAGMAGFLVAVLISLSTIWDISLGSSAAGAGGLWRSQANTAGIRMLAETVERISQSRTGREDALPVSASVSLPSGLAWALRDLPRAGIQDAPPALVLAPEGGVPGDLPAEYLGQVIKTGEHWGWLGGLPPLSGLTAGDAGALTLAERWVLLVRADVATFGTLTEGLPGSQ